MAKAMTRLGLTESLGVKKFTDTPVTKHGGRLFNF